MDNWHKILGGGLILALIYIVLMQGCGGGSTETDIEVIDIDTTKNEVVIDTNWYDTLVYNYIDVPMPIPYYDTSTYYDTVPYVLDDFDEFTERSQIYEDSVSNDTISIKFKATVWGFIDKMDLGYKIYKPYSIVEARTLEIQVTKIRRFQGLYGGLDVGIGKDGLTHTAPMLQASFRKINYNGGFDVVNKSVIFGAQARISFKRKQ